VLFEQVSKAQDADPIGDALGAAEAYNVTQLAGFEQLPDL
jgi:hypothetical protein